jgi:hypothetical protein
VAVAVVGLFYIAHWQWAMDIGHVDIAGAGSRGDRHFVCGILVGEGGPRSRTTVYNMFRAGIGNHESFSWQFGKHDAIAYRIIAMPGQRSGAKSDKKELYKYMSICVHVHLHCNCTMYIHETLKLKLNMHEIATEHRELNCARKKNECSNV